MNVFEELLHRLGSKTRIRSLFKDVGLDEMERIVKRLGEVCEEKKHERQELEDKRKEKQQSIDEIKKVIEAKGLSLADLGLLEAGGEGKRKRNVSKHNFEYQTASGDTVRWYGSTTGRLPKDFQDYLNRTGKKRLDCIADE